MMISLDRSKLVYRSFHSLKRRSLHISHVPTPLLLHSPSPALLQTPKRPLADLSFHLIADFGAVKDDDEFISRALLAVEGGVSCIQLRADTQNFQRCRRIAFRLKKMLTNKKTVLLINYWVDIALEVKADGVHIGQNDLPYAKARELLGEKAIIGLTVNTLEQVEIANRLGVDYLGFQLYTSLRTKPTTPPEFIWGDEGAKKLRASTHHRIVPIGGINLDNLESVCQLLHLGQDKDGIAMVGDLWRGNSTYETAKKIRNIIQRNYS